MFPLKPMSPIPSVTLLSKTQIPDCHLDAQDPAFLLHSLSRPAKCFALADKAMGFFMISLLSHPLLPRCILRAKTCHPLVSPQLPRWGFAQSELLGNMQGREGSRKGPQELDSLPTGSIAPSAEPPQSTDPSDPRRFCSDRVGWGWLWGEEECVGQRAYNKYQEMFIWREE